eukprot:279607_1
MSATWINLLACPIHCSLWNGDTFVIPSGRDRNNYIVIGRDFLSHKIRSIHKYNININKWNKINLNNIQKYIPVSCTTLDAKKQILYLVHNDSISEMQLNNSNINHHTHNTTINAVSPTTKSIILNDSLFLVGGSINNSILKWNLKSKTLTKFSDMYNKMKLSAFGFIYEHKSNCLLLFGGFD